MRKFLAALLALLATPALAQAPSTDPSPRAAQDPSPRAAQDPLPRAAPASVGLSPERLARLTASFRAEAERGQLPGGVIAIARRGRLAYFEAFGHLDGARTRPMPRDAIFPIASMTKPLTGVAMLSVLEEGKLALTDPVGRFLPPLATMRVAVGGSATETVPAARPITLTDLARHTSGIVYGSRGTTPAHQAWQASLGGMLRMQAPAFVSGMAALPLLAQPGTAWEYGLSTDVLGLVVEQASGKPLGTLLRERVFGPLGMRDTGFVVSAAQRPRYATPLPTDPLTGRPQQVTMGLEAPGFECGGACGVSTAADYIRFLQMLLNGGTLDGKRILSRKSVEEMTRDHMHAGIANNLTVTEPDRIGWGFGLTVAVRREAGSGMLGSPGMYGWNGVFGTTMWIDPKEQLAVVYMNSTPGQGRQVYRRMLNSLVYGALAD